jgi:ABC-type uncharacterized transport system permease subunit
VRDAEQTRLRELARGADGCLVVLFAILELVAPRVFQILFDAQFFGANVASLFPKVRPSLASLVTLPLMIAMSWVVGYLWAWLYNRFAKSF